MFWRGLSKLDKVFLIALALVLVLVIGGRIVSEFRHASWLADQSALAALDKEISDQLQAIASGQPYPQSLTELSLTYPDGGDRTLLDRFEYTSTGDSCVYRTSIFRREVTRTFPQHE